VVLTGCLGDGAAGLLAMPDAITAPLSDLVPLLSRLVAQRAPPSVPEALLLETQLWLSVSGSDNHRAENLR